MMSEKNITDALHDALLELGIPEEQIEYLMIVMRYQMIA